MKYFFFAVDEEGEGYGYNIVGRYSSVKREQEGKNMNEQKKGSRAKQTKKERKNIQPPQFAPRSSLLVDLQLIIRVN